MCRVEPVEGDMNDPDAIEMDEQLKERASFAVCLEKGGVPIYFVELHEPLRRWHINQSGLSDG